MTDLTRRSMLAAVGAAVTAGCVTDAGDGPGGEGTTTATTVFDGTSSTDSGGTPRTESRERETTDARIRTTTDSTSETTAGDWVEHASTQPDPDHAITMTNEAGESKTVRVRVERDATGETVFETKRTVESGVEFTAWNLKKASPEGVETFTVCAELVDSPASTGSTTASERTTVDTERTTTTTASERRDCVTVETSECYADVHVTVREDGSLRIIYAIC